MAATETKRTNDLLTGLGNYQSFMNVFEDELLKAAEQNQDLSLAVIDIDFFKQVNDDHGHVVGDEAIKMIAAHLSKATEGKGTVFRYGGEEFVIIFPNTEKEQAFLHLEQARQAFAGDHDINADDKKITLSLSFSAGLSAFPDDGNRLQDVIRKADGAMYRAKTSGRNKVSLAREEKMVTKTSHYAQDQLERLSKLAKGEGVGEAVLLREGLDDLIRKYEDQQYTSLQD